MQAGFEGRKAMELNGAVIAWMWRSVPEERKHPSGNFAQVPAEGFGEWGGWWGKTMISGGFPWEQLSVTGAPAENPLFVEFWGPQIPLRATRDMTRQQARAKEQARRESIDDTASIEVFEIPPKFFEFYTETGLGTRAIVAYLPSTVQVRFTAGSLGVVHDNYDAKPGQVVKGHPNVFEGYQSKLLREIDETDNLDLANVKDADGDNVLDADGNPIPITWMPAIAPQWIALRAEIQKAAA